MEGHFLRAVSLDWSSDDNADDIDLQLDVESHSSDMQSASHSSLSDAGMPFSEDESAESSSRGDDWFSATGNHSPSSNNNNNNMANYAADVLPPMSPQMWAAYSRSTQRRNSAPNHRNQSHQYSESAGLLLNTRSTTVYQRRNSSNFPRSMIGSGAVRPRAQTWSNQNNSNGPFLVPSSSSNSNSTPIRSNPNRQAAIIHHYASSPTTNTENLVFPTLHSHTNTNTNTHNSPELDDNYFPRPLQQLAPRLSQSTTQQLFEGNDQLELDIESDITTDEDTASLTCTDTTLSAGSEDDLQHLYNSTRTPFQLPFRRLGSSYSHNNSYFPIALRQHTRFGKFLRVSLVMSCYILMVVHPSTSRHSSFLTHPVPNIQTHSQFSDEESSATTTASQTPKHNEPALPSPGHGREIEFTLFGRTHQSPNIQAPQHIPPAAPKQKTSVKRRPSLSHANGGRVMPVFGSKQHELQDPFLDSPPSPLLSSSSSLFSTSTASSFSNAGVERFVLPSESSEDTLLGKASRIAPHVESTKKHRYHTQHKDNSSSFESDCLWWFALVVTVFGILYLMFVESSPPTTMTLRQHCQQRYRYARMRMTTMVVRVLGRNSSNTNNNQNSHHAE